MAKIVECGGGTPTGSQKVPVDFTGFWVLAKHEGMAEFLRAAGFPWVVRKAALKFGGSAVDLVAHSGSVLKVTSLNAKGSWYREYDVEREVMQRSAEGTMCKTSSWWEGSVLRSRMEGSELGVVESWRYLRGASMAVRTALRPTRGGPEAVMFWFFDRMETLSRHVARSHGGRSGASLLQLIESDQRRVARATRKDTAYLQDVLLDWQRWKSPADEFIHVAAPPSSMAHQSRHQSRRRRSPASGSPRTRSPMTMSKSPSNDSLAALPPGTEVRSEARSLRSDSRGSRAGRMAEGEMSNNALDRMARQAAALAMSDESGAASPLPTPVVVAPTSRAGLPPTGAAQPHQQHPQQAAAAGAAAAVSAAAGLGQPRASKESEGEREYGRTLTLSYPGGIEVPIEARSRQGLPSADSLTFPSQAASSPSKLEGEGGASGASGASGGVPAAPDSDVATRGSAHQRTGSVGSVGPQRSVHYKTMSTESIGRGGAASTPGHASPRSASAAAYQPLCPAEQVMAFRLHEFTDSRGITSVVPVATPNDTSEPQLLSMSPEQAEETAAKLRELESDMLLRRQESRRGCNLCGCFVITLASDTLPEHLRVWEMTLM